MKLDKLTHELIAIESVTGDENKILDYIEQYLASSEFSGEIIRNNGGIIAYHPSSSSSTALVGHVDTVPIDNNQVFQEDLSKVYGRGSVDMKSGLAVMLEVLTNNFEVKWYWVKGHSNNKLNNEVDKIAREIANLK